MTYTYRLPDGSGDRPDAAGRHTATVNVLHSALEYARFPGCEQCRAIAESEARSHNEGVHSHLIGGAWSSHTVADCPAGYRPPRWRNGRCHCATCKARRAAIGF